ncbi:MAG: hypothetical protein PG979_001445 [Rickettsia asembonensis]|nr:MAG: hypothetical protein PG979_001445 [Rickettsia asembonensis]
MYTPFQLLTSGNIQNIQLIPAILMKLILIMLTTILIFLKLFAV